MTYTTMAGKPVTTVHLHNGSYMLDGHKVGGYSTPQRYGIIAAVLDAAIASGHGDYATGMVDCAAATSPAHAPHRVHVGDVVMAHVVAATNGGAWRETNLLPMCASSNHSQGDADVTMVRYDSRPDTFTARTRSTNPKTDAPAPDYTPDASNVLVA